MENLRFYFNMKGNYLKIDSPFAHYDILWKRITFSAIPGPSFYSARLLEVDIRFFFLDEEEKLILGFSLINFIVSILDKYSETKLRVMKIASLSLVCFCKWLPMEGSEGVKCKCSR